MEHMELGSLADLLQNESFPFELEIIFPILKDVTLVQPNQNQIFYAVCLLKSFFSLLGCVYVYILILLVLLHVKDALVLTSLNVASMFLQEMSSF